MITESPTPSSIPAYGGANRLTLRYNTSSRSSGDRRMTERRRLPSIRTLSSLLELLEISLKHSARAVYNIGLPFFHPACLTGSYGSPLYLALRTSAESFVSTWVSLAMIGFCFLTSNTGPLSVALEAFASSLVASGNFGAVLSFEEVEDSAVLVLGLGSTLLLLPSTMGSVPLAGDDFSCTFFVLEPFAMLNMEANLGFPSSSLRFLAEPFSIFSAFLLAFTPLPKKLRMSDGIIVMSHGEIMSQF